MAKTEEPEKELPLDVANRWHVTTLYEKQTKEEIARKDAPIPKHHQLRFGHFVELTKKGATARQQLQEMADFMNRRGMVPRKKVECAADAPNPDRFRQELSGAPPR